MIIGVTTCSRQTYMYTVTTTATRKTTKKRKSSKHQSTVIVSTAKNDKHFVAVVLTFAKTGSCQHTNHNLQFFKIAHFYNFKYAEHLDIKIAVKNATNKLPG